MMLALCVLVAMTGSAVEGQAQFPDLPESYELVNGQVQWKPLISELIRLKVVSESSYCNRRQAGTRYEDAVMLYAAYRAFSCDPNVKRRLGADYALIITRVRLATVTFERELASMGVDVEAMKLHLKALALGEGFPDVPPTHWASKATRELRGSWTAQGLPRRPVSG